MTDIGSFLLFITSPFVVLCFGLNRAKLTLVFILARGYAVSHHKIDSVKLTVVNAPRVIIIESVTTMNSKQTYCRFLILVQRDLVWFGEFRLRLI